MENKTVTQELIEYFEKDTITMKDFYLMFMSRRYQLLEKEKQQLEDAFHAGFFITEWDKRKENKFEKYYNKTFKN